MNTLKSKPEYLQARKAITQARDRLEQLRQYKLSELRQVESKLDGLNDLFGGKRAEQE